MAWCSRITEDVVVCNEGGVIVIGPSTIGRRFFHGRIHVLYVRANGRARVWRRPGERYSGAAVIQRDR